MLRVAGVEMTEPDQPMGLVHFCCRVVTLDIFKRTKLTRRPELSTFGVSLQGRKTSVPVVGQYGVGTVQSNLADEFLFFNKPPAKTVPITCDQHPLHRRPRNGETVSAERHQ